MDQITQANQVLLAAMVLIQQYRKLREAVQKKGDPTDATTGALKTDAELIQLLGAEGGELTQHIDDLIAKHSH